MNPNNTPDFIPDNQMPDFVPDNQADKFFNSKQGFQSGADNLIDSTLGKLPGVGGIASWGAKAIADPVAGYADTVANKNQDIQKQFKTDPQEAMKSVQNAAGSGNSILDLVTGKGMARDAAPAAIDIATTAELPGMAKGAVGVAKAVPKALQLLTKGGTYKAIASAAEKATKEGVGIKWDEMANEIKQAVTEKLGNTKDVQKAINNLISEKTPAQIGSPSLNPNELLKWRQQIGARGAGKGVFQSFLKGSDIEDKVNSVARTIISKNLKGLAPDIATPDKIYSLYSKIHGDAPAWAGRIIAGELFKHLGKKIPGAGALFNAIPLP